MTIKYTAQEVANSYQEHKTYRKTAEALGISHSTVRVKVEEARRRGEIGVPGSVVPEGFAVERETIHEKGGDVVQRWVKTSQDKAKQAEFFEQAVAALKDCVEPCKKIKAPKQVSKDLATLYTFSDYHLGMLALKEENKESDWDMSIAESTITNAYSMMIQNSPDAEVGIINFLGDFMHFDGFDPVTPTNRHVLDASTRFPELVRAAIRIITKMAQLALSKHKKVKLLVCTGNHDLASSIWLQEAFALFFADNDRVDVVSESMPYYAIQHGRTALFFHHGHKKGLPALPMLFASQFAEIWGSTDYRYGHTGHHHHHQAKEDVGIIVEKHQTLASRDSHASQGGWLAQRGANAITYHKKYGEVTRLNVRPEMFE
jgi:hypothetical protein